MGRCGIIRHAKAMKYAMNKSVWATVAVAASALVFLASAARAADAQASTAFSSVGRVEFSQGGQLTIGNDILSISAPDYSRQIENTDVAMSVELYAMGQRASWNGKYIAIQID